jgi:hypothetical protein
VTNARLGSAALTVLCVALLSTFPGWHEVDETASEAEEDVIEIKPFPSWRVMRVALASAVLASVFALISALSQHTSAATAAAVLDALSLEKVESDIGALAAVLAWLYAIILLIPVLMLLLVKVSTTILERLTD